MLHIVLFLMLVFAAILIDIIPMSKSRNFKSLLVYIPVLLLTLIINILIGFGINVPGPSKPIKDLVSLIFGIK